MASFKRDHLLEIINDDSKSTDEIANLILAEHQKVLTEIRDERDDYKQKAEKAADLQKQLEGLQGGEDWQKKFEDERRAFEDFRKQTEQDAEAAKVKAAYRKLLADEGIGEKWLDRIMKGQDFSNIKLDKDGNLADSDKLKDAIEKEWGDVKTKVTTKGAEVENPPRTGNGKMTREEILKIEDTSARQKAIAENIELFKKG